jgi:polyhydroxyalkanoate synthase subunit PhaE
MTSLDYSKAFTDFWTAQGQALMKAQEQAGTALAEGMQAVTSGKLPMWPDMPADLSAGSADLARASKSIVELWTAATAVFGKLATTVPAMPGGDGIVEATVHRMVDPRSWVRGTGEMDEVLARMAQGPRFADLWEAAVMLEAWLQAGRRFTEQLAGRSGAGSKALDAKEALALWTETANQQLLETQRSERFLQTQAEMIRATTALRTAQQELVEHFGKQYGFPTRTELDDVHRTVTEIRRELRAMRRERQVPVPVARPTGSVKPLRMQRSTRPSNARQEGKRP